MRFVLTGIAKYDGMHILRDDLVAYAQEKGHYVDSRVFFGTDYLVTDSTKLTVKRKAAKSYSVPVITTEEYIELLGGDIELPRTLAKMAS